MENKSAPVAASKNALVRICNVAFWPYIKLAAKINKG